MLFVLTCLWLSRRRRQPPSDRPHSQAASLYRHSQQSGCVAADLHQNLFHLASWRTHSDHSDRCSLSLFFDRATRTSHIGPLLYSPENSSVWLCTRLVANLIRARG